MITHFTARQDMLRGRTLLIAHNGTTPLGRLNVSEDGRGAWVSNVWIEEPYRRHGVATALLRAASWITKDAEISLLVSSENEEAQTLYRRLGLNTRTVLRNINGPGRDEILMMGFIQQPVVKSYKIEFLPDEGWGFPE